MQPFGIMIRRMCEDDLDRVSELAILANPHVTRDEYRSHIIKELRENPDLSFVAVKDGRVIGYVQADILDGKAILEDIAVAREYQGRGVGKMLLKEELKALRLRGAEIIIAEVHYKCASAIPFYYKHKFRITGFIQNYFGIGQDAIILKKELKATQEVI